MNVYNLKRDDIFNTVNSNSTKDIDFNSQLNEYGIYDTKNYENIRPILSEYLDDYNIIQTKDDYNKEILLQKVKEQNEIAKNMGEISITRDPRITKYEDTYSITPYANFKIMDTTETDIDIVKSLDHCKGEWVSDRCNINKPCKRVLQEYIINNPNYTGDHCREDRERVRDGDTRMVYCNKNNRCNNHGKCEGYDVCSCEEGWGGDNCDVACPEKNCNNGVAIAPDCKCECEGDWGGDNCDECSLIDNNCNNHGKVNHATCSCECDSGYSGPNCEIEPDSCNYPTQINCYNNGKCVGGICNCPSGYKGQNCEETISCSSVNPKYCGENGVVTGNVNDCKCICNAGYIGDRCNNIDICDLSKLKQEIKGGEKNLGEKGILRFIDFYINKNTINLNNIDEIQELDEITGIRLILSLRHGFENEAVEGYKYILENKILEKIFKCYKNIDYIYIYDPIPDHKLYDIQISIFNILKKYNLLNYVEIFYFNPTPYNVKFLVNISQEYYDNELRDLTRTSNNMGESYFISNLLPIVIFNAPGLQKKDLKECKLKDELNDNTYINKQIPLEYFKEC